MAKQRRDDNNAVLRGLPSVDELLRTARAEEMIRSSGRAHVTNLARLAIAGTRADALAGNISGELTRAAERALVNIAESESLQGLRRVINATGVIIHTNLGRAPMSADARDSLLQAAAATNLEYGLETGKRGRRGSRVEQLLVGLTGAEDAIVVNNCAAAAFFVLKVFGSGGEVIISRGELVEIGGDFRVPDVLEQSGAALREVGTTNRTKVVDYERAIGKRTKLLLRVHPSNYRIVGYTATPGVAELATLAKKHKLILFEDIGSGALVDLRKYGLTDEPVVSHSIKAGADIVAFSGDKLLGGPQAGIIAGRAELIGTLRKHPLNRALRVDKLALSALEATLDAYERGTALEDVPVLVQLSLSAAEIKRRAEALVKKLGRTSLNIGIIAGESAVGGGAAPNVHPKTFLIAITHKTLATDEIERSLRLSDPPVIARIDGGRVLIDLRTLEPRDEQYVITALKKFSKK